MKIYSNTIELTFRSMAECCGGGEGVFVVNPIGMGAFLDTKEIIIMELCKEILVINQDNAIILLIMEH